MCLCIISQLFSTVAFECVISQVPQSAAQVQRSTAARWWRHFAIQRRRHRLRREATAQFADADSSKQFPHRHLLRQSHSTEVAIRRRRRTAAITVSRQPTLRRRQQQQQQLRTEVASGKIRLEAGSRPPSTVGCRWPPEAASHPERMMPSSVRQQKSALWQRCSVTRRTRASCRRQKIIRRRTPIFNNALDTALAESRDILQRPTIYGFDHEPLNCRVRMRRICIQHDDVSSHWRRIRKPFKRDFVIARIACRFIQILNTLTMR